MPDLHSFRGIALLLTLACPSAACAAEPPHAFEGEWIWDRAQYVPPPGIASLTHMVEETMSVSRDDGAHFTGQIRQVFDDGQTRTLTEDFAEDGRDQRIGTEDPPFMVRMMALPDGGRRVVSTLSGEVHDSECHVSEAGHTLTCNGTHKTADGSSGNYICVYHRDPHVIPLSAMTPLRTQENG